MFYILVTFVVLAIIAAFILLIMFIGTVCLWGTATFVFARRWLRKGGMDFAHYHWKSFAEACNDEIDNADGNFYRWIKFCEAMQGFGFFILNKILKKK